MVSEGYERCKLEQFANVLAIPSPLGQSKTSRLKTGVIDQYFHSLNPISQYRESRNNRSSPNATTNRRYGHRVGPALERTEPSERLRCGSPFRVSCALRAPRPPPYPCQESLS